MLTIHKGTQVKIALAVEDVDGHRLEFGQTPEWFNVNFIAMSCVVDGEPFCRIVEGLAEGWSRIDMRGVVTLADGVEVPLRIGLEICVDSMATENFPGDFETLVESSNETLVVTASVTAAVPGEEEPTPDPDEPA